MGFSYNNADTHLSVGTLDARASYSGNDNAVSLDFSGLQGSVGERELVQDQGMLEISGTPATHAFSLSTQGPELALSLSGEGSFNDPAWQGVVDALELESPFGDWLLQDSLSLSLSATAADIGNHCWLMRSIMVCGQALWNETAGLSGEVAVGNIPLAWLDDNLDENVPGTRAIHEQLADRPQGLVDLMHAFAIAMPASGFLEGMLDLSATFDGITAGMEQATLSAELVPRDVSLGLIRAQASDAETDNIEVERYGIDEVQVSVQYGAGGWQIDNSFGLYLAESGGLDFQGNFASVVELDDEENLGGNFELTFNNIAWVEALVPNLSQVSGELGASGTLAGTLERPC